jgi:hypothetical protein
LVSLPRVRGSIRGRNCSAARRQAGAGKEWCEDDGTISNTIPDNNWNPAQVIAGCVAAMKAKGVPGSQNSPHRPTTPKRRVNRDEHELLRIAAVAEHLSEHPLARGAGKDGRQSPAGSQIDMPRDRPGMFEPQQRLGPR